MPLTGGPGAASPTDAVAALAELGPRWPQRLREPDRRVAIAGPFAGSVSGIGQYDESVLEAIERRRLADPTTPAVEVFVDSSGTSAPTDVGAGRRPVRAIGRYAKPWDFDHLVAVLGSSPHHVATAELALSEPCHVWLHEASLVGVHLGLAHASGSESWAQATRRRSPRRRRDAGDDRLIGADELLDAPRFDELGVTLLGETLDRARSVIVSSRQAADTVRRLRPDGPPVLVLPLGHPATVEPARTPARGDIVAVGWLAANKSPELAIDVLVAPRARRHAHVRRSVGRRHRRRGPSAAPSPPASPIGCRSPDASTTMSTPSASPGAGSACSSAPAIEARCPPPITDLIAHGIPTVTTLSTAGPTSPGLSVAEPTVDALVAAISPLLDDDTWTVASADALARAERWTFDDVAAALLAWLDDVDDLDPTTIRHPPYRHPSPLASPPLHD